LEVALNVAESVRNAVVKMNLPHSGNPAGVQTISVGVAAGVPFRNTSVTSLLTASDHALYRAKYLGRNRVEGKVAEPAGVEMSTQS
jgi:diguanylate cyclase (GGDEF)-like protein